MGATEQKPQKSTTQQALNSANLENLEVFFASLGVQSEGIPRQFEYNRNSNTTFAMEDRHAFRLGDRVNCTLCLGEFLTNGLF